VWPDDGLLLQVKAMVVGRQGAVIGQIGKLARLELDVIFQKTTHLVLQVKVQKKHGQS
jgi:GTPase Era involved in 16S rRNA processing